MSDDPLEDFLTGDEDIPLGTVSIGTGLPGERFDLKCPECGGDMKLRNSKYGLFYGCVNWTSGCKGSHGAHADGRPLGRPANSETKLARIQAHRFFDLLWRPQMKRSEAYQWMQQAMRLPENEAHIGQFTTEQCKQLVDLVKGFLTKDEKL